MTQRRDFLKQAGLLSAFSLMNPGALFAAPSATGLKAGLQLYTLRDYIGKDPKGVLAKVAKAGYKEVETYGYSPETHYWGLTPAEFKSVLSANGLTTPSGHYDMGAYMRDGNQEVFKAYMAAANACGQQYITVPSLDASLCKTTDDFKVIAEKLNKAGELCKAAGLRLGYHNHNFEFKLVNGVAMYDVMLKETDASLVDFEMDIYWVVRAGRDPIKLIEANPKRFPMWHIKDMEKAQPEHNTEIGSGTIDFKKIMKYAKVAGLQHPFMEQEYFAIDAYQSIAQSAAYMKKNLLS